LTAEFAEVADELNEAARRVGQDLPGVPLALQPLPARPQFLVQRLLALQDEIVSLVTG
jgi:hypothetical protein